MHPFATYVLRSYFKATGWNEDNLFSNLTRSSSALLDFSVPQGLNFSISKAPNPLFKTTYSMTALPSLQGSVGYIFTSCDLNVQNSANVPFKDLLERFKIYDRPTKPEGKEQVWLAGERVDVRDYLLYGRLYIPAGRLDAVYSARISPTLQALVAAISEPKSRRQQYLSSFQSDTNLNSSLSNVMISLQHDVGTWCTEYTWSADDGMLGLRVLHNFGKNGSSNFSSPDELKKRERSTKRVDEDEAMEGGLKGRISAGAEFYFSAREKSAGVSTGLRFTTIPDVTPPSFQLPNSSGPNNSQKLNTSFYSSTGPPTTVTVLFNPMMGHISGAYAARVSRDLTLGTRFNFNCYSYESEWSMGLEWWLRKARAGLSSSNEQFNSPSQPTPLPVAPQGDEVNGVVKARMSTNTDVALMWEGRLRNLLVSLGVVSDLTSRSKPIRAIGLELSYFSSEEAQP